MILLSYWGLYTWWLRYIALYFMYLTSTYNTLTYSQSRYVICSFGDLSFQWQDMNLKVSKYNVNSKSSRLYLLLFFFNWLLNLLVLLLLLYFLYIAIVLFISYNIVIVYVLYMVIVKSSQGPSLVHWQLECSSCKRWNYVLNLLQ